MHCVPCMLLVSSLLSLICSLARQKNDKSLLYSTLSQSAFTGWSEYESSAAAVNAVNLNPSALAGTPADPLLPVRFRNLIRCCRCVAASGCCELVCVCAAANAVSHSSLGRSRSAAKAQRRACFRSLRS